jgi:hypothetical protein
MPSSDKVLYAFYDFETTQNTKLTESSTVHVPNKAYLQQFCTLCEAEPNINKNCEVWQEETRFGRMTLSATY